MLAYIANISTAFEVTDPRNATTMYRFVLTRIGGEIGTATAHKYLENWKEGRTPCGGGLE
jgi:hypothetical protein